MSAAPGRPSQARTSALKGRGSLNKRWSARAVLSAGGLLLACAFAWGSARGAFAIAPPELLRVLWDLLHGDTQASTAHQVFASIRLPRLLLGIAAGGGLGLAGALMQGLFRNPLADPGLIGVSSGAALAAGITIVVGLWWFPSMPRALGSWTLVLMAFGGSLTVTLLIYMLAQSGGTTQMGLMLLAGVAVNALASAGLGFLSFMATDEQLRNIQFWLLGSLGGARWSSVALVGTIVLAAGAVGLALARPLNALALGEAQARLLGVDVERVKRSAVVVTAVAVGAVTAATGIIGFIGLIAPHWVRLVAGPDHRIVLPASALLGAALVLAADVVARTIFSPAELPLGVLTAFIGVPMFLLMLRHLRER